MSDYTQSKDFPTKSYPVRTKEVSNLLKRAEPLIEPDKLVSRYLKNVPGIDTYSKDELKDFISLAYNEVELDLKTSIEPVQAEEHPISGVVLCHSQGVRRLRLFRRDETGAQHRGQRFDRGLEPYN